MSNGKFLYSVNEAAKALGISPGTVRNLINSNRLESVRMGRRVMVPAVALERLGGYTTLTPIANPASSQAGR